MKKQVQYVTLDGKTFPDRAQAAAHEVAVVMVKRISEFLCKNLSAGAGDKVAVEDVATKIAEHAIEFSDLVSARATRRYVEKLGASSAVGLVGRRPRGSRSAAKVSDAA